MSGCFPATKHPAAGKAGIGRRLAIVYTCPALPDGERWTL